MVVRIQGRGEQGVTRFSFQNDGSENVLNLDSDDGCTTLSVNVLKTTKVYSLKGWNLGVLNYYTSIKCPKKKKKSWGVKSLLIEQFLSLGKFCAVEWETMMSLEWPCRENWTATRSDLHLQFILKVASLVRRMAYRLQCGRRPLKELYCH